MTGRTGGGTLDQVGPRSAAGFSLLEAAVAAGLFALILGVVAVTMSSSRKEEQISSTHLTLLQNAATAVHAIRVDLRQMSFVPGQPVSTHSFAISSDYRAILIRRSVQNFGTGIEQGAYFILVEYRPVPTGLSKGGYYLQRTERTMNGDNLPGATVPERSRVYRSFTLDEIFFAYLDGSQLTAAAGGGAVSADVTLLQVELRVRNDSGDDPSWGGPREPMSVNSAIHVRRPELPYDFTFKNYFAHPTPKTVKMEIPPGLEDVRAPDASDARPLDPPPPL